MPAHSAQYLSSARQAGQYAAQAGVDRLLLTHLRPGSAPQASLDEARRSYNGETAIADSGLVIDLG
ncbi:MBL fold metallo-hydrolase [Actinacidiphila oryziradicis]|uniref:Uncharacterized protein n=1 Tax=Actinacidiphila oryziradicis TaxID=2571141 RepID=A0A4U0SRL7_9ACTN|nr:hypothetical protein [Actinacidiphila oryziradicis]TKA12794.1 hypothetical protein FCI23_05475 [Actinacidiphila oryziradicis]